MDGEAFNGLNILYPLFTDAKIKQALCKEDLKS